VDIGTSGYDTQTGFGRIEMVVPDLGCSTGGNQSPLAGFTYLANDLVVDFADQSSDTDGSIVAWNWDFGGDGMSTLQNPSHTFSSAGTYNITLTVTDDVGSTGTINQDVTVSAGTANTPPMASFSYVCNGRDCSFSDLSSDQDAGDNITAWSWDFGNGVTSNIQHPSLSYDSQGMYTVTLVVTDANSATGTVSTSFRAKNRGNTSGTAGGIDGGGDTGGTLEAERGKKKCSDGIDNDGDGLIDGSDPDCR
jgi:PKD repeat protein